MALDLNIFILAVILGTLAAIVYSLRVLLILERRVASMEFHIQRMVDKVVGEKNHPKKLIRKRK